MMLRGCVAEEKTTMKWAIYLGLLVLVNVLSYVMNWGFWLY